LGLRGGKRDHRREGSSGNRRRVSNQKGRNFGETARKRTHNIEEGTQGTRFQGLFAWNIGDCEQATTKPIRAVERKVGMTKKLDVLG